jgi:urease accessory protein
MKASYAHLDATLVADSKAYLEYLPGPTILNEDARCLQTTNIEMADDATVIVGDIFVPNGLTHHEPFSFDHFHSVTEARVNDSLVCADAVELRPSERDPRSQATVGEFSVVGTLYILTPSTDVSALADIIHNRLSDLSDIVAGTSILREDTGVTVRVLGERSADVTTAVEAAWDETRQTILGVGAPIESDAR